MLFFSSQYFGGFTSYIFPALLFTNLILYIFCYHFPPLSHYHISIITIVPNYDGDNAVILREKICKIAFG